MSEVVTRTLLSRRNVFQVVVIASLIGLGVNLLSAWFSDYVGDLIWIKWLAGTLLIILGFLLFVRFLLQEKTVNKKVEGVVILDRSNKRLVKIHHYDLSERLYSAFRGAFLENAALRASWESEPMFGKQQKSAPQAPRKGAENPEQKEEDQKVSYRAIIKTEMDPQDRPLGGKSVLLEAIEFCMLEFLSNHLSGYFGTFANEDKQVCTLTRGDIPHILLENRILSLLTTPIEDRQIFLDAGIGKHPQKGEVHSIFGSDGSVYERFDLKLPAGTRLLRPSPGCIRLQHRRFTLDLVSAFHGFCENLPPYFETLYVGKRDVMLDARKIHFEIRAQLHSTALVCLRGWEYYRWLDSFVRYFEDHVSFDAFLDRIQWASTAGHMRATLVREYLKREKKAQQGAAPNGGPTTPVGNSGVTERPPSLS